MGLQSPCWPKTESSSTHYLALLDFSRETLQHRTFAVYYGESFRGNVSPLWEWKNRVRSSKILIAFAIAILTVAALDDVPDPPAVYPHTISVALPLRSEAYRGIRAPDLNSDCSGGSRESRIRWSRFRLVTRATLPSDWLLLTRYAADPSPPIVEG